MQIEELKKILKGQKPAPRIFLLWGEEAFLKAHYKKQLIELLMPSTMEDLNLFHFNGKGYDLRHVDEAIESLPVMAEGKLLIFTDSMLFKPDGRVGAKAEYREYWLHRFKDIPPYVTILFDESEIDKRSALLKQVDKEGACVEFAYMTEEEMVRWTIRLFGTMGKQIEIADARYLNEITAAGMMAVRREAEKLAAYTGDNPRITRQDIELLVTPETEGRVFEMQSAMLQGDGDRALRLLEELFALKTEPVQILGAIVYNADKLLQTKLLIAEGADKAQIMSKLKISPFAATKFIKDSAKYSVKTLHGFIERLAETDRYIKSNSIENETLLSLLVSELATST
ncbi:MAG: DNA polymerase III subunit delta [Ruminococcaceae bacterium]|nr:DNA polymerase III subunit delta [Oscillospiraceae bacterium]